MIIKFLTIDKIRERSNKVRKVSSVKIYPAGCKSGIQIVPGFWLAWNRAEGGVLIYNNQELIDKFIDEIERQLQDSDLRSRLEELKGTGERVDMRVPSLNLKAICRVIEGKKLETVLLLVSWPFMNTT